MSLIDLFVPPKPDLESLPQGRFMYASLEFAGKNLPIDVSKIIQRMSVGLDEPRVSYYFKHLNPGEVLGNHNWHCDGRQEATEIHRLVCWGSQPTLGLKDTLWQGRVWQYDGTYMHKGIPVQEPGLRLMLRVSQTTMAYRDYWIGH